MISSYEPNQPNASGADQSARASATDPPSRPGAHPQSLNAIKQNGGSHSTCHLCNKDIIDNQWFCRLHIMPDGGPPADPAEIDLCSPTCALCYFARLHPNGNGHDEDRDRHEGPFLLSVDGE
jgi:hypothetical protein